jgi:hypothetical protein
VVAGRKKRKSKTQNAVGRESEKSGKAEPNISRCSKLAYTVKSDSEPVTNITLENSYS